MDLASIPVVTFVASRAEPEAFRLKAREAIQKPLALRSRLGVASSRSNARWSRRRREAT
jgi:hypothetical protein